MKRIFLLKVTFLLCFFIVWGTNFVWGDETVYIDIAESYNICGLNNGANQPVNQLYVHSQGGNYGEAQIKFLLDSKFDNTKVKSAKLRLYTISKETGSNRQTDPINIYSFSGLNSNLSKKTATLQNESADHNAKVFSYGSGNTRNYGFSNPVSIASTTLASFNASTTTDIDITSYIAGLSSASAGTAVYIGIQAGDAKPTNLQLAGYKHTNASQLVIEYTSELLYSASFTANEGAIIPNITIYSDAQRQTSVANGTLVNGNTYYFTASFEGYINYEGSFTVNGSNPSVSFTMTAKVIYSYTVNAKDGDLFLEELTSGSYYKDENVNYHYKQVINHEGTLYQAPATSSAYKTSFTLDTNGKVVNHSYSQPATPVTGIVFLEEAENLFTQGTGSAADTRCSMGAGGYASSKTKFVTLAPGKYSLTISNRCSGDRTAIHKFYKGDDEDPFFSANGKGYNLEQTSGEFTLMVTTDLYMLGGDNNQYVDWLYIVKTGDAVVTPTISDVGWATYCSEYALDFTGVTALTAYTASVVATVEGTTVKFNKVTGKVPANTGLLISGETASVPVCASANPVANIMEGVTTETVKAAETIYVLKNGTSGLGFYKNANPFTLRANSAYIPAASIGATARGFISLDDEATGIKGSLTPALSEGGSLTPTLSEGEGAWYDLSGRRVAKPTKGVYIQNGKKIIK